MSNAYFTPPLLPILIFNSDIAKIHVDSFLKDNFYEGQVDFAIDNHKVEIIWFIAYK